MNWEPLKHTVIIDEVLREQLHQTGYAIHGNIGEENIEKLKNLYEQLHDFKTPEGGMFYSLYSNDINYRQKVHNSIGEILKPLYDGILKDYNTVINSFIVKLPGPQSDFTLHQDSTGLDEFKYSPLSLWIPLQDTDLSNGTLCVVPKTHRFFHPFRGISFSAPFAGYQDVLMRYLIPVVLKAGDILMFDNRLVHYSHLNNSEQPRIIVMSGIFPKEAGIISMYKDEAIPGSPLEIYAQSDDFLITNKAFYENCTARPYRGEKVKEIHEPLEKKTVYDFLSWAAREHLEATNIGQLTDVQFNMKIVSEPL